jgi:hypothetical protein
MLHRTTRIISENLARTMDRRSFMRRTGGAMFAGMAALAVGRGSAAFAAGSDRPHPLVPVCAPPGPYCNLNGVNEPNGCHGGSCFQHLSGGQVRQCRYYYIYQAGCWTTAVTGGYWTCCDCRCDDNSTCGCAQFSGSPAPRPDGPGSAKA